MERDGQQLSARPALETEGLRYLHVTGESQLRAAGPRACTACPPGAAMFGGSSSAARPGGPGEACGRLGRPGQAWAAAGWRRTQVREADLERARRPSRNRTSLRGPAPPFFARILYFMRSKPFPACGNGGPSALGFHLPGSRHPPHPTAHPALHRPPRPPLSVCP